MRSLASQLAGASSTMPRDEAIYLKVKLREERADRAREFADVRDRIENIRSRARGDSRPAHARRTGRARPRPIVRDRPPAGAGRRRGSRAQRRTRSRSAPSSTSGCRTRSARRRRRSRIASRRRRWSICATSDGRVLVPAGSVDARRRELGEQGRPHRTQGQPDASRSIGSRSTAARIRFARP
mgnify:CR=1 FL=1